VEKITTWLFPSGSDWNPERLESNKSSSFEGYKVAGQGFLFDDSDEDATPLDKMHQLIEADPKATGVIFPYVGGSELNSDPRQKHSRYAINFENRDEAECRAQWPDVFEIVERKVKPYRDTVKRDAHRRYWWRYGETRPGLISALAGRTRVIVTAQTAKYRAFTFGTVGIIFSHKVIVIALSDLSSIAVLQGRTHEVWALFFGSTMKDDPVYTPTDCFETFPFPEDWQSNASLESAGQTYYEFRAALMIRNDEGLTKTYNRFHDPDEHDEDIVKLRQLHAAMDHAVLAAYGWQDLAERASCEFQLEYDDPEYDAESDDGSRKKKKKKPWRYKWLQDFHDEVLARLLELNAQRAEQERIAGESASSTGGKKPKRASKKKTAKKKLAKQGAAQQRTLLPDDDS
jgi:hypothetical protein